MATVVVLGAGVSGHTTALHLKRMLGREHKVLVVSPNSHWNWIPSNIWVGTGRMNKKDVVFPLAPIYKRKGIEFHQARGSVIHPEGDEGDARPYVEIVYTDPKRKGEEGRLHYDYLVNATGPRLNFGATPGLGPDGGYTVSVCTAEHAVEANEKLMESIEKMKKGEPQTLVIGMGAGNCTCEGAAFEYAFNVDHELKRHGVRDKADLIYLTNEYELGDFGVGGMQFVERGFKQSSKMWTESIFTERGVASVLGAGCKEITEDTIKYEVVDDHKTYEIKYDFAMLLPPFTGQPLSAVDKKGEPIEDIFNPANFMKVDGNYTAKSYDEWLATDWPEKYEVPQYPNVFAVGIAFAPPHAISKPRASALGTPIAPAPPRTGMPSGVMGKTVALTIRDRIKKGPSAPAHEASMARLGAVCVASAGNGFLTGSAASMAMYPVVQNHQKYPQTAGRNPKLTTGKIGLSGHWMKTMLHYLFIYKAKALPGWSLIPE
ncbi:NAD(P)/FAD-dependent oxidoreductase [Trueperella pyogenes]|uniref:NAD(P)/FAD-dependent oxidoreductase n=1 Tax=Trueperella pyogenes TaxID=1661 RepID=UPI00345D6851